MSAPHLDSSLKRHSFPGVSTISFTVALVFCTAMIPVRADDPIPKAFSAKRYETVRDHSPFAVATAEAPPPTPQASFAANLYVSGLGRWGDEDFVTIKSRDAGRQFSLFGHESDQETGISVASVNWTDVVGKSTVILKKGTETAKLEFNEAEVHGAPPPNPGQGKPGSPLPNAAGVHPAQTPYNMAGQPVRPVTPPMNQVINNGHPAPNGAPGVHRRQQLILPPQ